MTHCPDGRIHLLPSCLWLFTLSLGAASPADGPPAPLEVFGLVYPERLIQHFAAPTLKGSVVGTMSTLRNDTEALGKDAKAKDDTAAYAWSNSYVGLRGGWNTGPVTLGYEYQVVVDLNINATDPLETRDAYFYCESPRFGRIAVGKMDTAYKEFGDQVRMLGVSSSNIVSTAKVLSGPGWKGVGGTSFHNRRDDMVTWYSPVVGGFKAAVSQSWDTTGNLGRDPRLSAAAISWSREAWYGALATEIHRNWLPLSFGATPATTSIQNRPETTESRDQAWRLTGAWTGSRLRLGADLARLTYSERDVVELTGKFRDYRNTTFQVSAEYKWNAKFRTSANFARAMAGSGVLSGGRSCSTLGLGGDQLSLGAMVSPRPNLGLFALAVRIRNGIGATYGAAPMGAEVRSYALGARFQFALKLLKPSSASASGVRR